MTDASTAGSAPPSLGRGASIGRYVVLGLVGRGAMGEVYAAYDPELDRKVAVKLLRAQVGADDLTTAEAKARLLREAQAIAKLSHPNVIVVHDVGSFGDRVFIAMEFVEGNTVGYWLLAERRSWKEVLRVFMAAGRGLAAAHASQLVHRDFKVDNVMLGDDGQVRVMDFGLARRVTGPLTDVARSLARPSRPVPVQVSMQIPVPVPVPPAGTPDGDAGEAVPPRALTPLEGFLFATDSSMDLEATKEVRGGPSRSTPMHAHLSAELTQTGAMVGTPAYMAPEQFNGQAADERSDQFSFCVALYEGLHGERPFGGQTLVELSENVQRGNVRPISDSTRVPSWLRRVVLRGLRVDPAERWPSIDDLLAALQNDPSVVWRRWAMLAAAAAGVVAIGLVARQQGARDSRPTCQVPADRFARVWEGPSVPEGRRAAIAAGFRQSGQPYAADAFAGTARLLDRYVGLWASMYTDSCEATNVRGEQSAEVLDLRMSCLRDRWNELRALSDVLVEPSGEVVANAVKAAAALTPLDRCADVRTLRVAFPPPHDPAVRRQVEALRGKLATAKALEDAGRFSQALAATTPLVSEARVTGYPPVLAEAFARLGGIEVRMGRAVEAEINLDEAVWIAEASRYDEIVATASVDQIYVAGYLERDMPRARRWLRQAEAFLSRMEGHELVWAWMLHNFATALDAHGDLEEAASRYRNAIQAKERVLGGSHPDVGLSLTNLAMTLTALGRLDEALVHSNRGVEILGQAVGWEHPDTAVQMGNRADILNQLGRYADALHDAERAVVIWERELGKEHRDLPFFLGPLGEAQLGLEEPGKAVVSLERALSIAERLDMRAELRRLWFSLARALWQHGQDRGRAMRLGVLAAAPVADAVPGINDALLAQDRDLQLRAAAWVAAHQAEANGRARMPGRFGGARQAP
ncbi:MAG: serine/threonine-protein kinase [Bacteroidota bacterium]